MVRLIFIVLAGSAVLLSYGCGERGAPREEKITITIERPEEAQKPPTQVQQQTAQQPVSSPQPPAEQTAPTHAGAETVTPKPKPSGPQTLPPVKPRETKEEAAAPAPAPQKEPEPVRPIQVTKEPQREETKTARATLPEERALDFKTVAEGLDVSKHTKAEVKEFWLSVIEKQVVWTAKATTVRTGRRGFKILANDPSVPTDIDYNLVLRGREQQEKAQSISEGQRIKFRGTIASFDYGKGERGAIIVLTDVEIQ